jgi:hypothetical protein
MIKTHESAFAALLEVTLGSRRRDQLLRLRAVPAALHRGAESRGGLGRNEVGMALALSLLDDLCARVPYAEAYLAECEAAARGFVFDHGAMRTVAAPSGSLPAGRMAVARILENLGYEFSRRYPLDRLGMVGFVYTHRELPEVLPQYFVSELDPEHFGDGFAARVRGLVATSVDPLPAWARGELVALGRGAVMETDRAAALVRVLTTSFRRHHREPTLEEYAYFSEVSP